MKLTPAMLAASLKSIPKGCHLEKNRVGNLSIINAGGDYIGYVDLQTGTLAFVAPGWVSTDEIQERTDGS